MGTPVSEAEPTGEAVARAARRRRRQERKATSLGFRRRSRRRRADVTHSRPPLSWCSGRSRRGRRRAGRLRGRPRGRAPGRRRSSGRRPRGRRRSRSRSRPARRARIGEPRATDGLHPMPANLSSALPAKTRPTSSWSSARMFTQNWPAACDAGVARRGLAGAERHQRRVERHRGERADRHARRAAVGPAAVTTVTPVGKWPSTWRYRALSMAGERGRVGAHGQHPSER